MDRGHFVLYLSAIRLFEILSDASFGATRRSPEGAPTVLLAKQILACDLLIIDDLGTELSNSFTQAQLFNCINERLLEKKSTVISTNYSFEKIQQQYGDRIFSRLMDNYKHVRLYGDDIRMKKRLEDNK